MASGCGTGQHRSGECPGSRTEGPTVALFTHSKALELRCVHTMGNNYSGSKRSWGAFFVPGNVLRAYVLTHWVLPMRAGESEWTMWLHMPTRTKASQTHTVGKGQVKKQVTKIAHHMMAIFWNSKINKMKQHCWGICKYVVKPLKKKKKTGNWGCVTSGGRDGFPGEATLRPGRGPPDRLVSAL